MDEYYIHCTDCTIVYINNEESNKKNFGYNNNGQRYITCKSCREKRVLFNIVHNGPIKTSTK